MGKVPFTGQQSSQKSTSAPWAGQAPYLSDLYKRAQGFAQGSPYGQIAPRGGPDFLANRAGYAYATSANPYAGVGVGPLSVSQPGFQSVGLDRSPFIGELAQRSRRGVVNPYHSTFQNFQRGGVNPFLRDLYQQGAEDITDTFQRDVLPGIHSGFGAGGRTGSEAHAGAVGQATEGLTGQLSDLAERLYGSAYESDRNRALQAAQAGSGAYNVEAQQNLNALLGAAGEFGSQEGRKIGGYQAESTRQNNLAQQALARAQLQSQHGLAAARLGLDAGRLGEQAQLSRLGTFQSLADRDRGYRQSFADAPFNQLAQYSSLIGNPVLTQRSSGRSKGGGIG